MRNFLLKTILTFCFFAICTISNTPLFGQITIKGQLTDKQSGDAVQLAHVDVNAARNGITSDLSGYFEVEVDALPVTLQFYRFGYKVVSQEVTQSSAPINVSMQKDPSLANADLTRYTNTQFPLASSGASTASDNSNAVAVVLGVKDYEESDLPTVDFALNDAQGIKNYLVDGLGFSEDNIIFKENPRKIDFERIFGNSATYKGQLFNFLDADQSDVFVFYSGHGAPDVEGGKTYLVPSDANPNYLALTGYSVEQLYLNLGQLPAKSVTIVLDACFSGNSQGGEVIQDASSLLRVINPALTIAKGTVFSASQGDQVSSWYPAKRHGLFTYQFLEGVGGLADQNGDQKVSVEELQVYLQREVPKIARRLYNREQMPDVVIRDRGRILIDLAGAGEARDQEATTRKKYFDNVAISANQNNAEAQYLLGWMYQNGFGTTANIGQAFVWYKKSAEQNNPKAQYTLGVSYENGLGITANPTAAFNWYKKSAESGNGYAHGELGWMYQNGVGTAVDMSQAFAWSRKSSEQGLFFIKGSTTRSTTPTAVQPTPRQSTQDLEPLITKAEDGDAIAQLKLAEIYYRGINVATNNNKAIYWYIKSARQGNPRAQLKLAQMYINGEGTTINVDQAFIWFKKSAEQNMPGAGFVLAGLYAEGNGTSVNPEEAFIWYKKSAEQGNAEAQNIVGTLYRDSIGVAHNNEEAFNWYRKSARKGNIEAQFNIGDMFYHGQGTDLDFLEAFYWYEKAAEQGNTNAQLRLASMYYRGEGTDINKERAFFWYKKSAELKNDIAQFRIASMYYNGIGTTTDKEQAFVWYKKSAEQGNRDAQFIVANLYYTGTGVNESVENAKKWYQRSAEQGHHLAMELLGLTELTEIKSFNWNIKSAALGTTLSQLNLAKMYYSGEETTQNLVLAFHWYKKSAEGGNEEAQSTLARMYYDGVGTNKYRVAALYWYKKSAEQGNPESQLALAGMYIRAEGTLQSKSNAFHWYKKCAEGGNAEVQFILAEMYYEGEGTSENKEQAFYWYSKCAERGNAEAQLNIGNMLSAGEGVEKDLTKAFSWYKKSAEQENAEAQKKLGNMHEQGLGTDVNIEQALFWYRKSAEQGNFGAKMRLRRIRQ